MTKRIDVDTKIMPDNLRYFERKLEGDEVRIMRAGEEIVMSELEFDLLVGAAALRYEDQIEYVRINGEEQYTRDERQTYLIILRRALDHFEFAS